MDQTMGWVGGAIFALVGVGLLFLAHVIYKESSTAVRSGHRVLAEVVRKALWEGGEEKTFFHFLDREGKPVDIPTPEHYNPGEKVDLYHIPEGNPNPYRLATFGELWTGAISLAVGGLIFILGGAMVVGLVVYDAAGELLIGSFFATVGLLAAIAGGFAYKADRELVSSGLRAEGVVTGYSMVESAEEDEGGDRRKTRHSYAEVTFTSDKGFPITIRSKSAGKEKLAVGDKVPVLYPPDNPRDGCIDSFMEVWFPSVVCAGITVLFGGSGLFLLIYHFRTKAHGG